MGKPRTVYEAARRTVAASYHDVHPPRKNAFSRAVLVAIPSIFIGSP